MHSLVEIELGRSVRGLFLSTYGTFRWPGTYKIFLLEISIKVRGTATSKKTKNKQIKYKLTVDTVVHPMPMVDVLLVILFIYTV